MSTPQDYYRILGVSRDAPEREIKKVYYDLARQLHPDKAKTPEEASENASRLATISQAYNTLKDKRKREAYDQQIRGKSAASGGGGVSAPAATPPPPATPPPGKGASSAGAAPAAGGANADAPGQRRVDTSAQKKAMGQKAFVKGMQHFKATEWDKACSFFKVAVENDPESEAQYHLKYAQALIRNRASFTKAVEHAQRACEMEPYNMEFKIILADINETAGVLSRAKEIYEEILKWEPENSQAKNRLKLLGATSGGQKESQSPVLKKLSELFGKKK